MAQDLISKVFQAFDPNEPISQIGDPRYVDLNRVRGSVGLLKNLENSIRRGKGQSTQLLSGHRGCGKTTEFHRLRNQLSIDDALTRNQRWFVVYCEADSYINLNDRFEFTDVLLAIVQQTWIQVDAETQESLESSAFQNFISDLGNLLGRKVDLKQTTVSAWITAFTFEVKTDPNYRRLVQENLRPQATKLINVVNEVIQKATTALQSRGYAGLAVIVDNLDRMPSNPVPNTSRTNHEELFIDNAGNLTGLECHVIYTVPPALLYSNTGRLADLYGTQPRMLPMVPVSLRHNGGPNSEGLNKLKGTIEQRLKSVGTILNTTFDLQDTVIKLCSASGGFISNLVKLVQMSTNYVDDFPITEEAVEQTLRDARDGFIHVIRDSKKWDILRFVAQHNKIDESQGKPEDYIQLLNNFVILEYRDDNGPWYDVNPLIKGLL